MREHTMKLGESLDAIAGGVSLERVWDDPANRDLRARRGGPDLLFLEDVITIPDPVGVRDQGQTGGTVVCTATLPRTPLRLVLLADGLPCKGATCTVLADGAQTRYPPLPPVKADADGKVTIPRPSALMQFRLRIDLEADPPLTKDNAARTLGLPARTREVSVSVGALANEVALLQARLTNLGFHCGAIDGVPGQRTRLALRRFQKAFGLDQNGPPDDARTRAKLAELHEAEGSWQRRLTDEDKLCRSLAPTYHVQFARPNRIVLVEGPEVVIDAHMHVNSGNCCPLPLTWDKSLALRVVEPSRKTVADVLVPAMQKAESALRSLRSGVQGTGDRLSSLTGQATAITDQEVARLAIAVTKILVVAGYGAREGVRSRAEDAVSLVDAAGRALEVGAAGLRGAGARTGELEQRLRAMVPDQRLPASERMRDTSSVSMRMVSAVVNAYRAGRDAVAEGGRKAANAATEGLADAAGLGSQGLEAASSFADRMARLERSFAGDLRRLSNELDRGGELATEDAVRLVAFVSDYIRGQVAQTGAKVQQHIQAGSGAVQGALATAEAGVTPLRQFTQISIKKTGEIADLSVKGNGEALAKVPRRAAGERLASMFVMPMDMDFGHLDGYDRPVYDVRETRRTVQFTLRPIAGDGPRLELFKRPLPADSRNPLGPSGIPVPLGALPGAAGGPAKEYVLETTVVEEKGPFYVYGQYSESVPGGAALSRNVSWLPDAEFKQFEDFDIQVPETLAAAAAHPWTLLPLFHYDPRRWSRDQGTPSTERIVGGKKLGVYPRAWDEPFREHFRDGVRPFVGIKQYTALGYRPLDPRLPHQREFYAKCLELDLPIVCHCSSEGMYTLERPLYALREAGEDPARVSRLRAETLALMHARGLRDSLELEGDGKALDWREFWFSEKYVSPAAWREVLALPGHEKLRLCLAHFGGDAPSTYWGAKDPAPVDPHLLDEPWAKNPQECQRLRWDDALVKLTKEHPNFYVDISYFVFDGSKERFRGLLEAFPHLRDKLLFGTDWWMIEKSGIDYAKYVGQTREALDRIDPELWQRFSWINPVRFYRLQENAEAIARWLETRAPDDPSQRKAHAQAVKRGLDVLRALHPGATDAR